MYLEYDRSYYQSSIGLPSIDKQHDEFRAAGFLSTSKSSVCWDSLQTLGVQGEQSESVQC